MDEGGHDSQLLKGALTLMMLELIRREETYGYRLVERIHALGLPGVPEGSVYPALSRLERDGHVASYLVPSGSGPARKYYRLTSSGETLLRERRRAWEKLVGTIERLFAAEGTTLPAQVEVESLPVQATETNPDGERVYPLLRPAQASGGG
jgi:PadR family transcriptional regulator PadR